MPGYEKKISLEKAQQIIMGLAFTPQKEKVNLSDSLHRVLAEEIVSGERLPPFDRSPYDGYAFIAGDTKEATENNPVTLKIIYELAAGSAPEQPVLHGQAVKILTGAPIPEGADAVVKYEETEFTDQTVKIFAPAKKNSNIVTAGEDITVGDVIAQAGTVISPPVIGLMAAVGLNSVPVYRRPKIAIGCTGDELIEAGEPLEAGKIRNSNLYTISAYLSEIGADTVSLGTARDKTDEVAELIKKGLEQADMVITTGGVSVGDYDVVRFAAERLGAEILFWKIAIKPGSSVLAARLDGKLILGLSGNPAAAVIGLELLGIPFVKAICGREASFPEKIKAEMLTPFTKASPQRRFIRGRLMLKDGQVFFQPTGEQGNGVLSSLCGCDLLGEIPAGSPPVDAGTVIDAFRLN